MLFSLSNIALGQPTGIRFLWSLAERSGWKHAFQKKKEINVLSLAKQNAAFRQYAPKMVPTQHTQIPQLLSSQDCCFLSSLKKFHVISPQTDMFVEKDK